MIKAGLIVVMVVSAAMPAAAVDAGSIEVTRLVDDGAAALLAGDHAKALELFEKADTLAEGRSWDAVAGAASASLQLGREKRALGLAERMLELDRTPERRGIALQLIGSCNARKNRLGAAEDALREALDLLPGRPLGTRIALAVMSWEFSPSTLGGEPIDVFYLLTVRFSVQR